MSLGLPKKVRSVQDGKPKKPIPVLPPYGDYSIQVENLYYSYNRDLRMSSPPIIVPKLSSNSNNVMMMTDNDNDTTNSIEKEEQEQKQLTQQKQQNGWVLWNVTMKLQRGSRCLLIGSNGSGKSTLLRILAGRHMATTGSNNNNATTIVKVLGLNAFHDTKLNFHRAYLDCDWGMRSVAFVGGSVPLAADIPVYKMMEQLQLQYPDRRDELITLLGINTQWHMHQLSDGQRRRVQIFLGLLRPFHLLLLDEVTTSLDVCVRQDLLRWLHKESIANDATIIYATHIFDGLDDWPSHLYYLTNHGSCGWQGTVHELFTDTNNTITNDTTTTTDMDVDTTTTTPTTSTTIVDTEPVPKQQKNNNNNNNKRHSMLNVAENWLRAELEENKRQRIFEKAQYATDDFTSTTTTSTITNNSELYDPKSQGGYGSGRLAGIMSAVTAKQQQQQHQQQKLGTSQSDTSTTTLQQVPIVPSVSRQGRLSDIMGNSGTLYKVHRTAGK